MVSAWRLNKLLVLQHVLHSITHVDPDTRLVNDLLFLRKPFKARGFSAHSPHVCSLSPSLLSADVTHHDPNNNIVRLSRVQTARVTALFS